MTALRPLENRDGMALILTILVVALLTITVFGLFHHSWIQSALAASFRDETKALYASRAGQMAARLILVEDAKNNIPRDALTDEWAQGAIPIPFGEGEYVFVTMMDESGKLDLNQLTSGRGYPAPRWIEIFRRLLVLLELDPALADAAVDWLDADSIPLPSGAESPYYQSLKDPYPAKNGKLDSLDELALVKGFEPKVINRIRPYVTVWSDGRINANTAPPLVLLALDENMTEQMARQIERVRAEKPFNSRGDIKRIPGMKDIYPRIALSIDVKSGFFSVESASTFNETTKTIRAVYQRSASGTTPLHYKVY
ncbi:MAG: type II secretion system minor pseudopilin GspK [Candidatus Nitrospinota bacterium M3_3B_026]